MINERVQRQRPPGMAPEALLPLDANTNNATESLLSQGFRWHARRDSNPQPPDP